MASPKTFYSQVSRAKEILEKVEEKGKPVRVDPRLWYLMADAKRNLQIIQDELREEYA